MTNETTHAGWHSRGYLPHFDAAGLVQHVVFRLADSLPVQVLSQIRSSSVADRMEIAERSLDMGLGRRDLLNRDIASTVAGALPKFDGERYDLLAWCVMPNHVHALVLQREGFTLTSIVHSWKSFTANRANKLLKRVGRFWAPDYFDRAMRDEEQAARVAGYIEYNPVAAGLCQEVQDWPWSSASFGRPRQNKRS